MHNQFVAGNCYVDADETDVTPTVYICKRSPFRGLYLTPKFAFKLFGLSCTSPGVLEKRWINCTDPVKRAEAIKQYVGCPMVPISREHVGTVIAINEDGKMSRPYFMFAYHEGLAYLMTLDGNDKIFALKIDQCYPIQCIYKDVSDRAMSDDPMSCSLFDDFFRWLKKTPQYTSFVKLASNVDAEDREDMIRLFELMSRDGVTASTFEAEVQKRYDAIPEQKKEEMSKYTAVLSTYKSPSSGYNKIELEIMRMTDFKYATPQYAWESLAGDKPFPTTYAEMQLGMVNTNTEDGRTPEEYIRDSLALYDSTAASYWISRICFTLGEMCDMKTNYKRGVEEYLKVHPEFDTSELDFIREEDKESVFKEILRLDELDPEDPYRAWLKDPPAHMKSYKAMSDPHTPYVEVFRQLYIKSYL